MKGEFEELFDIVENKEKLYKWLVALLERFEDITVDGRFLSKDFVVECLSKIKKYLSKVVEDEPSGSFEAPEEKEKMDVD